MVLSKMAQAGDLSDEEDENDGNVLLLNFYQGRNRRILGRIPLHRVPDKIKLDSAALHYRTREYENDWELVLEDLGVDDITRSFIDFQASKCYLFQIYLALNGVLKNNKTFGDFIDVLIKRKKFHILRIIKPSVEELLSKWYSLNEEHPRPTAPDFSFLSATSSLAGYPNCEASYSAQDDTEFDSLTNQEVRAKYTSGHKASSEHFQNAQAITFANGKRLSAVSNVQINKVDEIISVFIMHSMKDRKYAKKLAKRLKENNFRVITSANIYYYLSENHTMIMKLVDQRVDFVIPIVSEDFMRQIKPTWYNAVEERDLESVANHFMYDRLLNEYSTNFRNQRVKPVCYTLESRNLKNKDQILSWSCYLPYDYLQDEKYMGFLKLLRCSKKLIKN